MNVSRPSKVNGLTDGFELFVVEELIMGVEMGTHVTTKVEACPETSSNEEIGRKLVVHVLHMFVY